MGDSHLIGQNLRRLSAAGIEEVIINTAYLGEQIQTALAMAAPGAADYLLARALSAGNRRRPLAGLVALGRRTLCADQCRCLLRLPLNNLSQYELPAAVLGHLILVPNPEQHREGDFALGAQGFGFNGCAAFYL